MTDMNEVILTYERKNVLTFKRLAVGEQFIAIPTREESEERPLGILGVRPILTKLHFQGLMTEEGKPVNARSYTRKFSCHVDDDTLVLRVG